MADYFSLFETRFKFGGSLSGSFRRLVGGWRLLPLTLNFSFYSYSPLGAFCNCNKQQRPLRTPFMLTTLIVIFCDYLCVLSPLAFNRVIFYMLVRGLKKDDVLIASMGGKDPLQRSNYITASMSDKDLTWGSRYMISSIGDKDPLEDHMVLITSIGNKDPTWGSRWAARIPLEEPTKWSPLWAERIPIKDLAKWSPIWETRIPPRIHQFWLALWVERIPFKDPAVLIAYMSNKDP